MQRSIRISSLPRRAACVVALSLPLIFASTSSKAADIDDMIDTVESGTSTQRIQLMKSLEFSGITDKRLFDAINTLILDQYAAVGTDKYKLDELSWLCKGLATSGLPEYKQTYEKLLASGIPSKLERHVKNGMVNIDAWAHWNPYLNSTEYAARGRKQIDAKHMSMIHSGVPILQKKAAGAVITNPTKDEAVYGAIAEELAKGALIKPRDGAHVDAMGWFCKALGSSRNPKYKKGLQKVYDTSPNSKVQRHASNALKRIG